MHVLSRLLFVAVVAVSGCQTTGPFQSQAKAVPATLEMFQSQACCVPLSELVAGPVMPVSESRDVWLGLNGKRLRSPVGTGYYTALKLPDPEEEYYFRVESFSTSVSGVRQIAIPIVLVLHEDLSVSRVSGPDALDYTPEDKIKIVAEREQLTLFVKVDRKRNPQERYVVVTTPERTYGSAISFSRTTGGGVSVIPLGSTIAVTPNTVRSQGSTLVSSPEGEIRISNRSSFMTKPFDRFIRF